MKGLFWVGPRESDIEHTGDLFEGSITLFGESAKNRSFCTQCKKRINHNIITDDQTEFIVNEQKCLINSRDDIHFMSYDPNQALASSNDIVCRTVSLNQIDIMKKLNEKISFRNWARSYSRVLFSKVLLGEQCFYQNLKKIFEDGNNEFIIQANISLGGHGTYFMDENNCEDVFCSINPSQEYLVSIYEYNSISVNMHVVIYNSAIILFPASIQIMIRYKNTLLYRGADFVAYRSIADEARNDFDKNVLTICEQLQNEGYRGVLGIDGIIVNNKSYLLETNNRFQASTDLLNTALTALNYPSVQFMNFESFLVDKPSFIWGNLKAIEVGLSNYSYIYTVDNSHSKMIFNRQNLETHILNTVNDGYKFEQQTDEEAFMFKVVFDTNICSITPDNRVAVHPNILEPSMSWKEKIIFKKDIIATKISLLNQGVIFTERAKRHIQDSGGIREGVHFAVDILIEGIYVNCPLEVKFNQITPFCIDYLSDELILLYYDVVLTKITICKRDSTNEKLTSRGAQIKDICLFATDRLRIQHSRYCMFPTIGKRCKFCEVDNHTHEFSLNDVFESIDFYFNEGNKDLNHILIGGRSDYEMFEFDNIIKISKYIRIKSDLPIYLMCLPPKDVLQLDKIYESGVTEVAFNIEIFDRKIARRIMPGKGTIPLKQYLQALDYATSLWGKTGDVRTCFIVGLESESSLLKGVETVCKLGVAPILSVFRPIPGTDLENFNPLKNEDLYSIYIRAQSICLKYNLELGPKCKLCRNNTLAI